MSVGINYLNIVIWFYLIISHALKDSRYAHVVDRDEVALQGTHVITKHQQAAWKEIIRVFQMTLDTYLTK